MLCRFFFFFRLPRLEVFHVIVSGLKLFDPLHGAPGRASAAPSAKPQNDGAAKKFCMLTYHAPVFSLVDETYTATTSGWPRFFTCGGKNNFTFNGSCPAAVSFFRLRRPEVCLCVVRCHLSFRTTTRPTWQGRQVSPHSGGTMEQRDDVSDSRMHFLELLF